MYVKAVKLILLTCYLTLFPCALFAADSVPEDPVRLKVALPPEGYPPYILTDLTPAPEHPEKFSGIMVNVLRTAASRAGIELIFQQIPEIRGQMMLDAGTIDARAESPKWVSNPEDFLWSEPITTINDVFIYCNRMPNHFESDEKMKGAEIITHLGYVYPTLDPLFESNQLIRDDRQNEESMLQAILQQKMVLRPGAIRATVMDRLVARWLIASVPQFQNQFSFSKRTIDSAEYHFQFKNKALQPLVEQLNVQLRDMRRSGEIEQITEEIMAMGAAALANVSELQDTPN